jgi:hypothetical protein
VLVGPGSERRYPEAHSSSLLSRIDGDESWDRLTCQNYPDGNDFCGSCRRTGNDSTDHEFLAEGSAVSKLGRSFTRKPAELEIEHLPIRARESKTRKEYSLEPANRMFRRKSIISQLTGIYDSLLRVGKPHSRSSMHLGLILTLAPACLLAQCYSPNSNRPPPPAFRHRRPAFRQSGPDLGRPGLRSGSGGLDPGPLCLHSGRGAFVWAVAARAAASPARTEAKVAFRSRSVDAQFSSGGAWSGKLCVRPIAARRSGRG